MYTTPAHAAPAPLHNITISPGMTILQPLDQPHDKVTVCTVGFTAHNNMGKKFAVTAGHCAASKQPVLSNDGQEIGRYVAVESEHIGTSSASGFGLIELNPGILISSMLYHTHGSSLKKITTSQPGNETCKVGATSGYTCGKVTSIFSDELVLRNLKTTFGDSGGPIFRTSDQALIGIVVGESQTGATIANPIANLLHQIHQHPQGKGLQVLLNSPP